MQTFEGDCKYCRKMRKIFHFTQVLIIWKKHRRLLLVSMSRGGRVWNSSTVLWPIFLLMEITEADQENFCKANAFLTMYKNFFITKMQRPKNKIKFPKKMSKIQNCSIGKTSLYVCKYRFEGFSVGRKSTITLFMSRIFKVSLCLPPFSFQI